MRLDKTGRDVTDTPAMWDSADCEIVITNYCHPSVTSGMHTNGRPTVWIRMPDGCIDWVASREPTVYHTAKAWIEMGIEWFLAVESDCIIDKEKTQ
jgi:hypothetical protein